MIIELAPPVWIAFFVHQHNVDPESVFVKGNQLYFVDFVAAGCNPEDRKLLALEKGPAPGFAWLWNSLFAHPSSLTFHIVKPWQWALGGEPQAKDHIDACGFLCRISISTARDGRSVRMGVQPMGKTTSTRAP
jgi:hypothetical protein